jgi:hypothetical protein
VDEWPVPDLRSEHRNKIKAALFRADAAFARSRDADSACLASMRHAFDGISQVLFDVGILTEQLLEKDIPLLVWDSAIAGGWWRFASETRQDIFPEELGHYWVWRDEREDWPGLFRAEAADWRSKLLDGPTQHPKQRDSAGVKPSRKTPAQLLNENKVKKRIRTQELVAEDLGLERSVYFDLKAGRKVCEETYVKAALHIGCSPGDLKP